MYIDLTILDLQQYFDPFVTISTSEMDFPITAMTYLSEALSSSTSHAGFSPHGSGKGPTCAGTEPTSAGKGLTSC
jgi:hypothetical protein